MDDPFYRKGDSSDKYADIRSLREEDTSSSFYSFTDVDSICHKKLEIPFLFYDIEGTTDDFLMDICDIDTDEAE